jgi:hypothetical protein
MPEFKGLASIALVVSFICLAACSHGHDEQNRSGPRSNIDLTVSDFAVNPSSSDPEDVITLSGTIHNIGTEMANPLPGDSFLLQFNLSQDGTVELNENGFLQVMITDPIPPGGSLPFSYEAPYGNGDTLSAFGNFCNSFGCIPPEPGVIGVKVDRSDVIRELDEGNNFQFVAHDIVGTRVAAAMANCDSDEGCDLIMEDGLFSDSRHRPCATNCGLDVLLPNELHRFVNITLKIQGCTKTTCGWGVTITAETQKPGLPVGRIQIPLVCNAYGLTKPDAACFFPSVEIRDPNY